MAERDRRRLVAMRRAGEVHWCSPETRARSTREAEERPRAASATNVELARTSPAPGRLRPFDDPRVEAAAELYDRLRRLRRASGIPVVSEHENGGLPVAFLVQGARIQAIVRV
jgi:hypothetical protein